MRRRPETKTDDTSGVAAERQRGETGASPTAEECTACGSEVYLVWDEEFPHVECSCGTVAVIV